MKGMISVFSALILLVLIGILVEERQWHSHLEAEQQARLATAARKKRVNDFLDASRAIRDAVSRHPGEIYGCQNGFSEWDKSFWIRGQRVSSELEKVKSRSDPEDFLSNDANLREANARLGMAGQLIKEAIVSHLTRPPEWMTQRPEWTVTQEDIRRQNF